MSDRRDNAKIYSFIFCIWLIGMCFIVFTPINESMEANEETAKFVFSEWEFPDAYNQGIVYFETYENSTGSWVQVGSYLTYEDENVIEWNASIGIKLKCFTWLNSTMVGIDNLGDGQLYQRHNITVYDVFDFEVWSQDNFTYVDGSDSLYPPMYFYEYEVIFGFLPLGGITYTVTVTYEIYFKY